MFVQGAWVNRQGETERRPRGWYDNDGTQHARGRFFILFDSDAETIERTPGDTESRRLHVLYGCVRTVSLVSFGHWMMGRARIGGQTVILSGAYGSDGLPGDSEKLKPAARSRLVRLTDEEVRAFWSGSGGHNDAGSEAHAMRAVAARIAAVQP